MTTYTLFGQATPSGTITAGTGNAGTNGIHFNVNTASTLDGIWHWSSSSDTQLPTTIGLYSITVLGTSGTLVHSETPSWSGAAGSGWVYAAFSSPPSLAAGTEYMAVQFRNDSVNRWFSLYDVTWPVTSGILTAPRDESTAALSQGWFSTGTALAFPASQSGTAGENFGLDVQVSASSGPLSSNVVQQASGTAVFSSGTSGTVTATFGVPVAAGNCLVACITASNASAVTPTVSAVKTGTLAENWAAGVTQHDTSIGCHATIWTDPNTGGGATTVSVTVTFGQTDSPTAQTVVMVDVYEVSGVVTASPVDKTTVSVTGSDTASWSSGTTPVTSQASEIAFGVVMAVPDTGGTGVIAGPSSPWANGTALSKPYTGSYGSYTAYQMSGFETLTATGTVTYNGTVSAASYWDACALTLALTTSPAPPPPVPAPAPSPLGGPNPAVPSPPAGWKPVQADFTLWVTSTVSYLAQPANFRAQLQAAQALTGGAFQVLHYDAILEDPYAGWSAAGSSDQAAHSWLCPPGHGGWYEVTLSGFAASQGAGTVNQVACGLVLNGALWQYASDDWAPAGALGGSSGSLQVPLLPGDYVQAAVFVTVSVSTPAAAGEYPAIELNWVSS